MSKGSLALDARLLKAGGIGSFIEQLILALHADIHLSVLHYPQDKKHIESFGRVKCIEVKAPIYSLQEQYELRKKIPRVDTFFAPHFNVPLLPIRAIKRITCVHDTYHLTHRVPFTTKVCAKLLYNAAFGLSEIVTTDSYFSKEEIMQHCTITPKKLEVIPIPIAKRYRNAQKLPPPRFSNYILAVGNVKPHKNLKRLIAAYATLHCQEPLVIVGRREGFITKEKEWENLPKGVYFTDYVNDDELLSLYAHAKLFVFPSLYEGYGLPPLEAMAMGCPVIASKAASIPEVCKEAAYYIDPLSELSIAEGITRCLTDQLLQKKMIERGAKVAYSASFEKFKEGYLNLLL